MVNNKPLTRPYFCGGYVRGGRLTSHDFDTLEKMVQLSLAIDFFKVPFL